MYSTVLVLPCSKNIVAKQIHNNNIIKTYRRKLATRSFFNFVNCVFQHFLVNKLSQKYECREVLRDFVAITVKENNNAPKDRLL